MKAFHRALGLLDEEALREAQSRQDALAAQRIIQAALFTAMADA
jgi:xylose isomerase